MYHLHMGFLGHMEEYLENQLLRYSSRVVLDDVCAIILPEGSKLLAVCICSVSCVWSKVYPTVNKHTVDEGNPAPHFGMYKTL